MTRSMSSSTSWRCCAKVASANPASTRRQVLLQVLAPTLILRERDHSAHVRICQAFHLLLEALTGATQLLAPVLHLLREPVAPVRPLQRLGDTLRVGQHLAEVAPDQRVELPGRAEACGALLLLARVDGPPLGRADVVAVARRVPAPAAGRLADPAADQGPQQVALRRVF